MPTPQSLRKEVAVDHCSFAALTEAAIAHEAKGDDTQRIHQSLREEPVVDRRIYTLTDAAVP